METSSLLSCQDVPDNDCLWIIFIIWQWTEGDQVPRIQILTMSLCQLANSFTGFLPAQYLPAL